MKRRTTAPPGCIGQQGQAMIEVAIVTLVLIVGFWGMGWWQGEEGGTVAMLIRSLHGWHQRFASLVAIPL